MGTLTLQGDPGDFQKLCFSNKESSEILVLRKFPGDGKNVLQNSEIDYFKRFVNDRINIITTSFKNFISGKDIYLGIYRFELIKKLGKGFVENVDREYETLEYIDNDYLYFGI